MAAALLKHRAPVSRGVGFLLRSFDAIRSLGAASLPPSGAEEAETRPKRKKKKTLFEVAQFLPNWGIGYKMAKTHWRDVCYEITKINLYKVVSFLSSPLDALFLPLDGRHGKAWGIRYKAAPTETKSKIETQEIVSSIMSLQKSNGSKILSVVNKACDSVAYLIVVSQRHYLTVLAHHHDLVWCPFEF
ncbi:hypothetical protein MUK42_17322 [Musa troglodytarum]|uniref:Uncharacterized protein n=1 Tax=Musa troglodytarum TaxID=320322 RepID=A0A9E7HAM1_9LILI|nr:hypothetical protein MUK42_17322 [Musa troglodytarum]